MFTPAMCCLIVDGFLLVRVLLRLMVLCAGSRPSVLCCGAACLAVVMVVF